jgi:hypothetical protein
MDDSLSFSYKELVNLLKQLLKDDWERYLNENFQLNPDPLDVAPLQLTLASVSGYGQRQGGHREAYSLLFLGPPQPVLPQRIYRLSHDGLGELDIFLVPVGPHENEMGYEAVFT